MITSQFGSVSLTSWLRVEIFPLLCSRHFPVEAKSRHAQPDLPADYALTIDLDFIGMNDVGKIENGVLLTLAQRLIDAGFRV